MESLHNRLSRTGTMEKFASLASKAFQIHGSCRIPAPRLCSAHRPAPLFLPTPRLCSASRPAPLFLPALRPVPRNVAARPLGSVMESATCCATTWNVPTMAVIAQVVRFACRSVCSVCPETAPELAPVTRDCTVSHPRSPKSLAYGTVRNCTFVQVPKACAMG